MRTEHFTSVWRPRHPSPDGTVWATVETPVRPSIAEHNPGVRRWRDLLIDPDLGGPVTGRARPVSITFERADGREPWTLPLPDVLPAPLAWHPRRPLVAGLAVRDRRAHVWLADHETRRVTLYVRLRAAVSFTAFCGPPVAWCGDGRLALLVPPGRAAGPRAPDGAPVVREAAGPGHVTFDDPPAELERLAGAHLAVARLAGNAPPEPVTPPLLVRRVEPERPDGRTLRLSIGRAGGSPGTLRWTDALLDIDTPGTPQPVEAAAEPAPPNAAPRPIPDRPWCVLPPPDAAPRPLLLWIRAFAPGQPTPSPAPVDLEEAGHPAATLDLPLHWRHDATPGGLHGQIIDAVESARRRWDGPVIVGGHGFAATLALYAVAHLPSLASAIAHSGCYNRSLTPTGFHYEKRSYWDAPEIYDAFSALRFADRIDRPVLLVHGAEDRHPATPPEQTIELYRAIVATGGQARLVLLPHEGHEFRYRETHEALAREHRDWLDRH